MISRAVFMAHLTPRKPVPPETAGVSSPVQTGASGRTHRCARHYLAEFPLWLRESKMMLIAVRPAAGESTDREARNSRAPRSLVLIDAGVPEWQKLAGGYRDRPG
jgi:hypothetical protein